MTARTPEGHSDNFRRAYDVSDNDRARFHPSEPASSGFPARAAAICLICPRIIARRSFAPGIFITT
ncbi:MAG TPA: hypothetical protein VFD58_08950 [Blastocatellia bacterium]|nr:hypothetical protein [Blastocatellia bacterium]